MTGERTTTHFRGDACPGGHPELIPATGPAGPADLDGLLAGIVTALHGESDRSWSQRAIAASDLLHKAGYHTAQMTRTDWRTCPVCSQHPERHAAQPGDGGRAAYEQELARLRAAGEQS